MIDINLHSGYFLDREGNKIEVSFSRAIDLNVSPESKTMSRFAGYFFLIISSSDGTPVIKNLAEFPSWITATVIRNENNGGVKKIVYRILLGENRLTRPRFHLIKAGLQEYESADASITCIVHQLPTSLQDGGSGGEIIGGGGDSGDSGDSEPSFPNPPIGDPGDIDKIPITGDITHDDSTGFIPWKPAETTDPSITPGIS